VVLWLPRTSIISGGHQVQVHETTRALRESGVDARVETELRIDTDDVDLVHGFDLSAEEIHRCRSEGLPVVISTIYWDQRYGPDGLWQTNSLRSALGTVRLAGRYVVTAIGDRKRMPETGLALASAAASRLAAYEAADLLLPNSRGEAGDIERELGVTTPMTVVPNGVRPDLFDQKGLPFERRTTVLCVARLEPHKNQLGLIKALEGTSTRLVILGPEHRDHPEYARRCRAAGAGWVEFVDAVPQEELRAHYAEARVHVLPSWYETTGLVSLEAALSGCSVVSTDRGHAGEYLGTLADYCDPSDSASIRRAIDTAWGKPPDPDLRARILDRYTWEHTAEITLTAYQSVLTPRARRTIR
jgi:glycosyltransferase involved in cell wall biosynthesis